MIGGIKIIYQAEQMFLMMKTMIIFILMFFFFMRKKKKYKKYKNYSLPSGRIFDLLAKDYFIIISGLMIKKKIFDRIGYFNQNFNIIGDFDLVMKMSKTFRAHSMNKPMIFYRYHENNFSKINTEMHFDEFKVWFEDQNQSNDEYFINNKKYFERKLISLEITHLLLNGNKNMYLFEKIINFPIIQKKIKYLIAFFISKKIIKYLMK